MLAPALWDWLEIYLGNCQAATKGYSPKKKKKKTFSQPRPPCALFVTSQSLMYSWMNAECQASALWAVRLCSGPEKQSLRLIRTFSSSVKKRLWLKKKKKKFGFSSNGSTEETQEDIQVIFVVVECSGWIRSTRLQPCHYIPSTGIISCLYVITWGWYQHRNVS